MEAAPQQQEAPVTSVATVQELPVKKKGPNRAFIILGVLFVAVLATWGGYTAVTAGQQTTDDAQIDSDVVSIAPRVGGQILKVHVKDNQLVKKGDIILEIDGADLRARRDQAAAEVETAESQAAAADAQLAVVQATVKGGLSSARASVTGSSVGVMSADAQIAAAKASLVRAQADKRKADLDLQRAKELRAANAVPQERLDNAQASADTAAAAVEQAQAQVLASNEGRNVALSRVQEARGRLDQSAPIDAQIAVARAQAELAHARVRSATAVLALASLQVVYTSVFAPADGIISKLSAREGAIVQPGQSIANVVPSETYVVANFKETQIGQMKVGNKVEIGVDSFPGKHFEGTVLSIAGGTGSRFSLLPPDNASGNFVKVVQRVPVRIGWAQKPEVPMLAGLSAEVTVHVQ